MSMVKSKCPAFLREKEIRDIMCKHNCTYKMALIKNKENKNVVVPSPNLFTVDELDRKSVV